MNLKELINLLAERPHYLFKISVPGTPFMHNKTLVQNAIENSGSIEAYFNKIITANSAKTLLVELFTPNGSSYKNRGKHVIFLEQPQNVATEPNNATNSATKTTSTLQGVDEQQVKTPSMTSKDELGYAVLQVKHEMVTNQKNSLEQEVKDLRKKVDILQEEKLALVKENTVSNERNKLEMEKALFEVEKGSKEGLSGLMGELNDNPETLKMLIGLFKPDHPMFKEEGNTMEGTKQIEAPTFHADKEINALLTDMPNTIKDLDPKIIARIYYIFLEGFAKDPSKVKTVFELLFPDAPKE